MATAAALTGCLIPERFDASIQFKPDGSYNYKYNGSAVHFLAAAAIKEKGSLLAKDEASLQRDAEKANKEPGVKKMAYLGQGRFDVQIDQDVKPGQQVSALKVFTVARDKEGAYVISVLPINDKDRDQLRSFGIKINGKAEVILPSNAKVLSHNATSAPGLLSKAYAWKIDTVDDRPTLRFMLTQ